MKVTIINFSARNSGNCSAVCKHISAHHEHSFVSVFDAANKITPCGNCDYECLKPTRTCPNISEFHKKAMESIMDSDIAYFIVPNYCGMPCANYYSFNERNAGFFNLDRSKMQRYMSVKKKFVVISNTESEQINSAMNAQTSEDPDILYLKTRKYGKNSISGDILDSEEATADLNAWLG